MAIYKDFNGYCPEQDTYETIEIKYFEVRTIGNMNPSYKKGEPKCSYDEEHECDFARRNKCPIYLDAPVTI